MDKDLKQIEDLCPSKREVSELSIYELNRLSLELEDQIDEATGIMQVSELKGCPKLQHLFKTQFGRTYSRLADSMKLREFLSKKMSGGSSAVEGLIGDNASSANGLRWLSTSTFYTRPA